MKRLLMLFAASALASPALAQHGGHHMPGHTMPAAKKPPAKKPPAKKPVTKAKPAAKPAPKAKAKAAAKAPTKAPARPAPKNPAPKAAAKAADPHAGHVMPEAAAAPDPHAGHAMPAAPVDPHAGHSMPATTPAVDPHAGHPMPVAPADPHAGHAMPAEPVDPHAGHDMGALDGAAPTPPNAPPPQAALSGPAHAADLFFPPAAMAEARRELHAEHGSMETYKLLIDRLEARVQGGRDGYAWEAQGWYGGDIDKLWLKTEGEGAFGHAAEQAEVQALWSHAIDPWFDLQLGVRHDFRPDPERTHLVVGVQGLAPYWFEVDGALFLSNKGDLTARLEGEYDLRLTQQLILQPRVEADLALQDVAEIGVGSGLSAVEAGLRLRYEIVPQFAPYVGVGYERAFGDTADLRRGEGERAGGWTFLAGVRAWF